MTRFLMAAGFLALFSLTEPAFAKEGFHSREEADLGATNNADLTKENPKGDAFWILAANNSYSRGDNELGLRLSFTDYLHETENNVFGWRLGDSLHAGEWTYFGAILGQTYTSGSPATTDSSFTNVGLDLKGTQEISSSAGVTNSYSLGYKLRDYTAFESGRIDHTLFAQGALEREVSARFLLEAFGEAGLDVSSNTDYSQLYLQLGASGEYDLGRQWRSTTELTLTESYFLDRTISTSTAVTNRRGLTVLRNRAEHETYTTFGLNVGALKTQTSIFRWGGELNLASQKSKSGLQDYSALGVLGRLILSF